MIREIPQKVDTQSRQGVSTLLRRTRSATVVGLALTLGTISALTFQSQATAGTEYHLDASALVVQPESEAKLTATHNPQKPVLNSGLAVHPVKAGESLAEVPTKTLDHNHHQATPGDLNLASVESSQSGLQVSNDTEQSGVAVAKRAIIPQVPSLELPSLASTDYLPEQFQIGSQKYIWPAEGVLTSGYGWRWGRMHRGIDIAAPTGTTVVAVAPGVVTYSQYNPGGYGNLVEIKHPDGTLTLYAHNNRLNVSEGEEVYQGQKIAEMGSTGRSTGPHTHFEISPLGRGAVNPLSLLNRG